MIDLFIKWAMILFLSVLALSNFKDHIKAFFLYGYFQKIIGTKEMNFRSLWKELHGLFGTRQVVTSHASEAINPAESTPGSINTSFFKHYTDLPKKTKGSPNSLFTLHVIHLDPTKNIPYFQMLNENPYTPHISHQLHNVDGDNKWMFAEF